MAWTSNRSLAASGVLGADLAASRRQTRPALVAYDTRNAASQRLLDSTMLNAVLVLVLVTSILGPLLVERFAPRMRANQTA